MKTRQKSTTRTLNRNQVSDKKLIWTAVTFVALFAVFGGWIYFSASQAATLPADEYTFDERVEDLDYASVPTGLQAKILEISQKEYPSCVKGNSLVDYYGQPVNPSISYAADGFAAAYIDCKDASELLLANTSTGWQKVGTRTLEYKCDDLKAHHVPVWFLQALVPSDDSISEEEEYNPTITCIPSTPGATASVEYNGN